jgi:hypothetical protein
MSTLVAQTISNGTVSTSSANVIQGSAKAWVNYNGSSNTIRGSYNVSSVTDNGTGNFTVNFTNAMPDANYSAVLATTFSDSSGSYDTTGAPYSFASGSVRLTVGYSGGNRDNYYVGVAVFR